MNSKNYSISISSEKLSCEILKFLYNDNIGAVVTFIGVVRNINDKKSVQHIHYHIFYNLFNTILNKECIELLKNDTNTRILIQQKDGIVKIGEINLIIGVSSFHRTKSFEYVKHLIEFIKNSIPVWKKEYYIDNTYRWLNTK